MIFTRSLHSFRNETKRKKERNFALNFFNFLTNQTVPVPKSKPISLHSSQTKIPVQNQKLEAETLAQIPQIKPQVPLLNI